MTRRKGTLVDAFLLVEDRESTCRENRLITTIISLAI